MLAVGPLGILPSPVWATLPVALTTNTSTSLGTANTIIQTSGSGSLSAGGTQATLTLSDKSVLVWTTGAFNVGAGEQYTFLLPSGGAVLNKVGYNTNGSPAGVDTALINGSLTSTGKVFVLANGNIMVGAGANITATGGLVLSTLLESSDFPFTTGGNLSLTGTNSTGGTVSVGGGSAVTISGNTGIYSGAINLNSLTVNGDMIVNQSASASGTALALTGAAGGTTVNNGNLTVTSNAGPISATASALKVLLANSTTTLNTGGNAAVTLNNGGNDFATVKIAAGTGAGGTATIVDMNNVVLGASTIGQDLTVNAGSNITTSDRVAVNGVGTLTSTASFINVGNNSTFGSLIASATGVGAGVTYAGVGNLDARAISTNAGASISTNGTVTLNGTISAATSNVAVSGGAITANPATAAIVATGNAATLSATAGSVGLPAITAGSLTVNAPNGSISQTGATLLTIGNATANGTLAITTSPAGTASLANANPLTNATITLAGGNATISSTKNITFGQTNLAGSLTANTVLATLGATDVRLGNSSVTPNPTREGTVTIGSGFGGASSVFTVGGALNIMTNSAVVSDNIYTTESVFGSVSINTVAGTDATGANVVINAAASNPDGLSVGRFGQWTVNAGAPSATTGGHVILSESVSMNLANISGNQVNLRVTGTASDILINGQVTSGSAAATFRADPGSIIQSSSGNLNLAGAVTFNASNTAGLGTNLSTPTNSFGGVVTVTNGNSNIIVSGSSISFITNNVTGSGSSTMVQTVGATSNTVNFGKTGTSNATNVTINSAGPIIIGGSTLTVNRLTLITSDASAASITQTGGGAFTQMNGTLTVASAGNVLLSHVGNNITGSVVINNTVGDTTVYSARNLTISGTALGNLTAVAGTAVAGASTNTYSAPWNLVLGNLNVGNQLFAGAMNGNTTIAPALSNGNAAGGNVLAGSSGTITQSSNTRVNVQNQVDFVTFNNNIVLNNTSNSFGRVQASTGGGSGLAGTNDISITEDSWLKVGALYTTGNVALTSRQGSIFEDPANNVVIAVNGAASVLTATANNGSVLLGGVDRTAGTTTSNIVAANVRAQGSAKLLSSGNITLGSMSANSLTVTSGNIITQSAPASIYGSATFNTTGGTGDVILSNTSNSFGGITTVTSVGTANVSLTESGTLNLRSVTMPAGSTGTFTATSIAGDIIDTGLQGFKPGGTTAAPGNGLVTLNAANGNIVIDDPTSDFQSTGGVVFNGKNVTLSVLGGTSATPVTMALGSSSTASVATNLTVTSILGDIVQLGAVNVSGAAFFQTGTKNITLGSATNTFGTLRFVGNQVSIQQTGDMKILTGSSATSATSLASNGGNLTIVRDPAGGLVTFGSTVGLSATGNITLPKLIQVVNTLSVNAAGTKDLSALSITGDLGGKTPIYLGTGPDARNDPKLGPSQ